MININALRGRLVEKGYTQEEMAKELGMSSVTFYRRLKRGVFGSDEIEKMIELLDIKEPSAIFFAKSVTS